MIEFNNKNMSNQDTTNKVYKEQLGVRLAKWVIQWRWAVLGLSLLIILGAGYGVKYLGFNSDYNAFFGEGNPQLEAMDALQEKYTRDKNVFIGIQPKDGNVFTKSTLSAIEGLVPKLWQTPYSSRVDALTNFQYTRAEGDDIFVNDLVEEASQKTDSELLAIREAALNDPLLLHRMVNAEGTVTGINIAINQPDDQPKAPIEVGKYVRKVLQDFEQQHPEINTYLSGMMMVAVSFQEASIWDLTRLMPLMFLIVLFSLWLFVRSISATISTLFILVGAIIIGLGTTGWFGILLTSVSIPAITIIMTLAVADCVHILMTLVHCMKKGDAKETAIIESLRINLMPVIITSLTTIIGFLSLNFSDSPPFRDLGNISAFGMVAAFSLAIFTLPALLSILPIRIKARTKAVNKFAFPPLNRLADFVIDHQRRLLWVSSFLIIGISTLSFQNELGDEFVKYFDTKIQFRQDTDFISNELTGIYNVEFSIPAGEAEGINNGIYLENLENFTQWLRQQPEVVHVRSYSEVVKRINQSMHGDEEAFYAIPKIRQEAAQYLFMYEMSLPLGLDLNNQINVDKSETRLTATIKNISSNEVIAFAERSENWLKENSPTYMHALGASKTLMFSHLTRHQIFSLLYGIGTALLVISIVLMIALNSFKYGALSLIPNITPITVGFGIWAMTNGNINAGTAIVFGMVLGIIVDDTVHFIAKYLNAKRTLGKSPQAAIRYAFNTVGQALIVTTVILFIGFFILGQSLFTINSDMAQMAAIIILLALVIDFLVLPPLLLLVDTKT